MSNTYFKFKQFTIEQSDCAMKVCTDSCILGAWFAKKALSHKTILDIGAGTGLLMLMLGQKTNSSIHGIELDASCFNQLQENIGRSDWKERFAAYRGDVRTYSFLQKYDFIITNPPFFENDLPSFIHNEKLAKHSSELSLVELIEVIDGNLSPDGSFGILLPFNRWDSFSSICSLRNFHLHEKLFIKHSPSHDFSRAILYFSRYRGHNTISSELTIHKEGAQGYTNEFIDLLKDYYLYL